MHTKALQNQVEKQGLGLADVDICDEVSSAADKSNAFATRLKAVSVFRGRRYALPAIEFFFCLIKSYIIGS